MVTVRNNLMAAVELRDVTKRFGATTAVSSLNLVLQEGSMSTLLGPSGCGKTTTLRMISGLDHPTSGSVTIGSTSVFIDGKVCVPAEKRGIGMVFQSYAVWPHLNVFENVAYPLRVRRERGEGLTQKVRRALQLVHLDQLETRFPHQLSGGQQQRVALARAIVAQPTLLLLDEPLSNLDAQLRDRMRNEIRSTQQALGLTGLYVTHDQQEALAISDHVVVMSNGAIEQQGRPADIFERPLSKYVAEFLGWSNFLPVQRLDDRFVRFNDITLEVGSQAEAGVEQAAYLAVRPENVALQRAAAPDGRRLFGRVSQVTYLGSRTMYEVEVGSHLLQAHLPSGDARTVGDCVLLDFPPSMARLVPEQVVHG